jgi:ubiquinone/menaquinone biosynthesis C-methylase UbiE
MQHEEAVEMIADVWLPSAPQAWADLGCGSGAFTRALAALLPSGSTIHAVDTDAAALRKLPFQHASAQIVHHVSDFTAPSFTLEGLDGILMANALHYVRDQAAFLERAGRWMKADASLLIVEYDTAAPNPPWVPFPVPFASLPGLFPGRIVRKLGSRPSVYRKAELYAAQVLPATSR